MIAIITLFMNLGFLRLAGFVGRLYRYFHGYYSFAREVAPILGLNTINIEHEDRDVCAHDRGVIGKLARESGESAWDVKGRQKGYAISLVEEFAYDGRLVSQVFEMPLPHVTRELNVPIRGRGARHLSVG